MKSKSKNKNDRELRRKIEALKAELSSGKEISKTSAPAVSHKTYLPVDDKAVKKDLMKTIFLSGLSFAVILAVWVWQNP